MRWKGHFGHPFHDEKPKWKHYRLPHCNKPEFPPIVKGCNKIRFKLVAHESKDYVRALMGHVRDPERPEAELA